MATNDKKTIEKKEVKKTTTQTKRKPVLGKGLGEIFGGDVQDVIDNISKKRTNGLTSEIPLSKLVSNPYQPRKNFNVEELEGLAQSIKQNGLFTPILVKENPAGDYYIIAGERRSKAAKLAGLKTIKAVVAELTDNEMQRIALVENIQRSELNPIEVAISLKSMIDTQKLKHEEVAEIIGKSRTYVVNLLGLLKLNKKIIDGVLDGKISYGHARPLITLSDEDAVSIFQKAVDQNLSVREIEGYSKASKLRQARKDKGPTQAPTKSEEILYAEELIRNKVKSKVIITDNEIKIKYRGKDQLTRILDRMDANEK